MTTGVPTRRSRRSRRIRALGSRTQPADTAPPPAEPMPWNAIGLAAAVCVALLAYSAYAFRNMEKTFADVI